MDGRKLTVRKYRNQTPMTVAGLGIGREGGGRGRGRRGEKLTASESHETKCETKMRSRKRSRKSTTDE